MPDEADSRRLRVAVTDADGRSVRAGALAAWLRDVAPPRARGAVTIALVDDATMRRLNRRFAGRDRATDVLSFPAFAPGEQSGASADRPASQPGAGRGATAGRPASRPGAGRGATADRPAGDRHLGDIVIATGIARRQARDAGHSYARELRVLALHGLLHLLGYDHDADDGAMARVEARLRRKGGLAAGVIERARPA
jgi:probable rRNA maturation factor